MQSIKLSGYRTKIQFDDSVLVAKQNSYATKILDAYIVYDLDDLPTNMAKNSDKSKWVYTGYGIAFDGVDLWSFGNDFARNVTIFGVDNSSSSHVDNRKNNF